MGIRVVASIITCKLTISTANLPLLLQKKIAGDSGIMKFDEEDIIVKVGECLEVITVIFIC